MTGRIRNTEQRAFFDDLGGEFDVGPLSPDSALRSAWTLGQTCRDVSLGRPRTAQALDVEFGIASEWALNAAAGPGYAVALNVPLILTLQSVAAAIWATPTVAPWLGNVGNLAPHPEADGDDPPGFEMYLAILGKRDVDPTAMRSGIPRRTVDAIAAAGDARFDAFVATWTAAIRFVWNHELAHILYGHVDLAANEFGLTRLAEDQTDRDTCMPAALSQFMEHVADMDGAMQLFASFYGSLFEQGTLPTEDARLAGASTVLGVVVASYVLHQGAVFRGHADRVAVTHPPLFHRAAWILGAESRALDVMRRHVTDLAVSDETVERIRQSASELLRSAATFHPSLWRWIGRLDDAEAEMNAYLSKIRSECEPHFDRLSALQKV